MEVSWSERFTYLTYYLTPGFLGFHTWVGVWHAALNFSTQYPECVRAGVRERERESESESLRVVESE